MGVFMKLGHGSTKAGFGRAFFDLYQRKPVDLGDLRLTQPYNARHKLFGKAIDMDEDDERGVLEIFRHLKAGEDAAVGLSAIADHWHGDSMSFRHALERLSAKGLIEIRDEGYCITRAGKAAISRPAARR